MQFLYYKSQLKYSKKAFLNTERQKDKNRKTNTQKEKRKKEKKFENLTKLRRKNVSSKKNATSIRKVPITKQISEILRIPAPTPETVDLLNKIKEYILCVKLCYLFKKYEFPNLLFN